MEIENAAMAAHFETEDAIAERQYTAHWMQSAASRARSVFIEDGQHRLQFTRCAVVDTGWLVTMDGHHYPQLVDTDHVQRSIDESTLRGCSITTYAN